VALSSAEGFAEGGIKIASRLGATHLAFGVETHDEKLFDEVSSFLISKDFEEFIKSEIEKNPALSYPTLREKAVVKALSEDAGNLLKTSNNILGIEYLKAIKRYASHIKPIFIKREGQGYNDKSEEGELLSASAIRELFKNGKDYLCALPDKTASVLKGANPIDYNKFNAFLYSVIMSKNLDEIKNATGSIELANIIKKSAERYSDYNSFRSSLSRKKYPETKIDRALISLVFGIGYDKYLHEEPEYATLLASNKRGKEIISAMRKEDFKIFSKSADIKNSTELKGAEIEIFADRIYASSMKKAEDGAYFLKKKPYIKEEL
ncbi:MAG: nucleotidyltransferase family protein, partial [Clostridia bacterium]|nr:nucleotidyltransferase family protein [Clostridia bacterium]